MGCCAAKPDGDLEGYDLDEVPSQFKQGFDTGNVTPRTEKDPTRLDFLRLQDVRAEHLSANYMLKAEIGVCHHSRRPTNPAHTVMSVWRH